jgi:predicted alpha/beta-hydrolase family hydrolase
MSVTDRRVIETQHGRARLEQHRSKRPWATLALTHGAGGGSDAADLQLFARRLPPVGVSVALIEQPWRVAGRRIAGPPASLDEAYRVAVSALRMRTPLVVGGRSAGARVGCRTGRDLGAAGVLALAFPLHPPRRPERSRAHELAAGGLPVLVVQGTRDALGTPGEFPPDTTVVAVPDADHSFAVPKRASTTPADVERLLVETVLDWLRTLLQRP